MNKRVLIVEDHDSLRLVMGAYLSKYFDIVSAKNGLEAMGWLSQGELPDLIITDVRMPEIGGAQFLRNLKCSGVYRDIPVVVVSGSDSDDDRKMCQKMGAADFFRKPFDPANLQQRVSQILN